MSANGESAATSFAEDEAETEQAVQGLSPLTLVLIIVGGLLLIALEVVTGLLISKKKKGEK